ncbi:Acg family FMN-binding oxidoreductase [Pragia fontium]|uniref:Nitroreductase n=1 Tax=Pragia fontium DSM 5563 = ATCC 49100 TaxID=1122977 RepID=A0AAJ4WDE5_9GAMM|nr:hypothetical protein [Pragia fontium]SFD42175.1 hypothetical protein SAMN02745723_11741 [Pragia fontium DSM 5563 = ATCC 49100]VEJ55508.1 Putative NAD(P)H nitroreductase RV3131/MT3217 [Pragia fontium]
MQEQNDCFKQLIEFATKAPSGHNTQPWKFKPFDNKIEIYPDFDKKLPVVDKHNRELFISLGCATENLCIAASAMQYDSEVSISPEGIITIALSKNTRASNNDLFDQVHQRQTNKNIYEYKMISDSTLIQCVSDIDAIAGIKLYFWEKDSIVFKKISELVLRGNTAQMRDPDFKNELIQWMRFNKKEVEVNNDGLSYAIFGAPSLPRCISKRIINFFLNDKSQNSSDIKKIDSSSHLILLTSSDDTIVNWIHTGRYLQRFLLRTTQDGIAHAYINQPCEVTFLREEMSKTLPIAQESPQILLRVGYAKPALFSRRQSVDKVLL